MEIDGAALGDDQVTPHPGEHNFVEACLPIRKGLHSNPLEVPKPPVEEQSLDEDQKPVDFKQNPVVEHKPVVLASTFPQVLILLIY